MQFVRFLCKNPWLIILPIVLTLAVFGVLTGRKITQNLVLEYKNSQSVIIKDRNGLIITMLPNDKGNYALFTDSVPDNFAHLLLKKEDKWYYFHLGVNPLSIIRSGYDRTRHGFHSGSSTITQQTVKILLGNENDRSWTNKLKELIYSLALEANMDKRDILLMYANSVYFGNSIQGVETASRYYCNQGSASLSPEQAWKLIIALNNPSARHPYTSENAAAASRLADYYNLETGEFDIISSDEQKIYTDTFQKFTRNSASFEILDILDLAGREITLTVDSELTSKLRQILKRNIQALGNKNVTNGAIVVLKQPENQLLAVIGTPDPSIEAFGYKINMAARPRAVGSTIKPFIYAEGFQKSLRPYTIVTDKEYKYLIGTGFALYPKNYNYRYHGDVTLHYALANSLNVPAVKVLEYVGLENFYDFLLHDLSMHPVQDLSNYQLGIALGSLEMDLLSLTYYFSLFSAHGRLNPLSACDSGCDVKTHASDFNVESDVFDDSYIQLVNKILSDRKTGVAQFGLKSRLNIPLSDYAVKTGTSREYHDSWTIGYTPDFTVGVWLGNADETAMDEISGSAGAGHVWSEAMNLLASSDYYTGSSFIYDNIEEFRTVAGVEFGLPDDDFAKLQDLMHTDRIIDAPHENDVFLFEPGMGLTLKSRYQASWSVNDQPAGTGFDVSFYPDKPGIYLIEAIAGAASEQISVVIEEE